MKRFMLAVTVTALMVILVATSAVPSLAAPPTYTCRGPNGEFLTGLSKQEAKNYQSQVGWQCDREPKT